MRVGLTLCHMTVRSLPKIWVSTPSFECNNYPTLHPSKLLKHMGVVAYPDVRCLPLYLSHAGHITIQIMQLKQLMQIVQILQLPLRCAVKEPYMQQPCHTDPTRKTLVRSSGSCRFGTHLTRQVMQWDLICQLRADRIYQYVLGIMYCICPGLSWMMTWGSHLSDEGTSYISGIKSTLFLRRISRFVQWRSDLCDVCREHFSRPEVPAPEYLDHVRQSRSYSYRCDALWKSRICNSRVILILPGKRQFDRLDHVGQGPILPDRSCSGI